MRVLSATSTRIISSTAPRSWSIHPPSEETNQENRHRSLDQHAGISNATGGELKAGQPVMHKTDGKLLRWYPNGHSCARCILQLLATQSAINCNQHFKLRRFSQNLSTTGDLAFTGPRSVVSSLS